MFLVDGNDVKLNGSSIEELGRNNLVEFSVPGVRYFDATRIAFLRPPEIRPVALVIAGGGGDEEDEYYEEPELETYHIQLPWMYYFASFSDGVVNNICIAGSAGPHPQSSELYGLPLPNLYSGFKFCMPKDRHRVPKSEFSLERIINETLNIVWGSYWNYDLSDIPMQMLRESELDFVPYGDYYLMSSYGTLRDLLYFWEKNVDETNFADVLCRNVGEEIEVEALAYAPPSASLRQFVETTLGRTPLFY